MTGKPEARQRTERLRHALWAGLIALVASFLQVPQPIDEIVWMAQAHIADFKASGDIVYVDIERDPTDPEFPQRREELARAIDRLREAGAHSVYLDMAFSQPSRLESDRALNKALQGFGRDAYLISNVQMGITDDALAFEDNIADVGRGITEVGGDRYRGLFGIVWNMPYAATDEKRTVTSAAAVMVGESIGRSESFPINYGFDIKSIPMVSFDDLNSLRQGSLTGKIAVIGHRKMSDNFVIPGDRSVPESIIHIYAAETLRAGYVRSIPSYVLLLPLFAFLFVVATTRRSSARSSLYALLAASMPVLFSVTTYLAIRPSLGVSLLLVLTYSAFRLRSKWRKQVLLVDEQTSLPTFAALEADRDISRHKPTIIVAKLHRFEEVRLTLAADLQAEYIMRIKQRLTAASPELKIYLGPGHSIGWHVAEKDRDILKDHLEGLRALFAAPLRVGNQLVDVGITFGVDISPSGDTAKRLASAIAAAERTTESYLPILIAEARTEEELIWNISLQAKIDTALEQNEIFLVYQPKISTGSGEMVGMEALVRWRDPERGIIPPDRFIGQCEESGRMGHLTRHVLREACRAQVGLAAQGIDLSIAVNVSATLLHDPGLVSMVRQVIADSGADACSITLEITETFRIADMDAARLNLLELSAIGMPISMDDFGVGAASLEALLRLPFDELKIDRMFIDRIGDDPKALAIVQSAIDMGRRMGITVVAEGVEDATILGMLRAAGCPLAQGFGICRPVALEEAVQFRNRREEVRIA